MTSRGGGRSPVPASVGRGVPVGGRGRGLGRGAGKATGATAPPRSPGSVRSKPPVLGVTVSEGELVSVKACITSLDSSVDAGDLKFYFETACQFIGAGNIEVIDPLLLGGGKATIVLNGLSMAVLQQLKSRDYNIKGYQVKVDYQELPESDEAPCPEKNESNDDGDGEGGPAKVEVTNVPDAVNEEVLKAFFEGAKSGGCAGAVANVDRIKPGVFHITFCDSKVAAQVMSEPRKFKREFLQLKLVEEASCAMEDSDYQSNQIEVRNVPHTVSCELVKAYFEGAKSGGSANAVAECKKTEPGVFIVTFHDPNVAARVMSKSHTFKKAALQLQYVRQLKQKEEFKMNQLAIHGIPDGVKKDVYEVTIAGCLGMDEDEDFELQISGSSAVITFAKSYSDEELQGMMGSIASEQVKGTTVTVEMVKAARPSIHVCNVTADVCDEEFLGMYFGSVKRSGGGEVESVDILSETEAIITFSDPAVIQSVLKKQHPFLGPSAVVEEYGDNTSSQCGSLAEGQSTQPLEIPVDPMLAQSISRSPSNLEQSVLGSRVTFSTDEQKGILVFSPTSTSKPSWRQECQEHVPQYIAANLTKKNINVPKEAAAQAMSIAVKLEKDNPGLRVDANTDGTVITLAGETSSVSQAREAIDKVCSEIVTDEASVILSPEDFDFVEQVKQHELPANIECKCDQNTFSILLKGPIGAVNKLKASIDDLTSHVDSPVMLDPLVTEFLKTQAGRAKLEKFLLGRKCHAAVHFSQFPNLTLHLLSVSKEANNVKAIVGQLPLHVTSQAIPIPDTVAPIISDLDEFIQLCHNIEQKYGVLIKQVGHEVSAAGFTAEVTGSLAAIKAFLNEKSSPLPSLEMKVGTLVARSIQRSPQGIQKCLHSFPVSLQFDTGRGILQFTPLHYLKPEWEEACKSSVSEYIQSNVAEVKIVVPEKAYSDIMSVLYSSEQDGTFVYQYPPNTTSLSFAGETNIVQSTGEKVAQICANHSFISETLSLKAEEYEFLTQLKMQDLVNKFHNIDIDSVPDTHSVQLSGPTKGVKAVKEHITTLLPPTIVTVKLDQAITEFLASEKGKERLLHLLREKRSDKCAVYISDSPIQLMLLCTHKHKKAAEKVSEYLPECTSVSPLQIPDLLLPFLSELPEFLKEVERLERENFAKILVKDREIHVAGFKEGVSQATETLSAFVREKMIHFQPIQIPIDPMIAMCVQKDPVGLQACVSSISVKCTLKTDTNQPVVSASPTMTTKPDWKKECERLLTSYIDSEYLTEQIEIPKEAASDVFPILVSMKTTGNFHFETPGDGAYAIVAGEKSAVKTVQEKIGSICSRTQTSDTTNLSHREYNFFTQVVQQTFKSEVTIECSPAEHSVTVRGSIRDVTDVVKSMKEKVQHTVVPIHVDEVVVQFIHTVGRRMFENELRKGGIKAAIHFNMSVHPPSLELLCDRLMTQGVEKLTEKFPEQIKTTTIPLPKTVTELPVSQEFDQHCAQLASKYHVYIQAKQDALQICGFKDTTGEVEKSVHKFIKKKCTVTQSLPIQKGIWRLFGSAMKQKWIKIENECRDSDVTLTQPSDDEGKILITLKGDKVEVHKFIQAMNHLVKSVQRSVVPLSPEIRRYFSEKEDGGMKIPGIEKSAKVCIEICEVGEDIYIEEEELRTTTRATPKLSKECTAQVIDMKRIEIYVGDISEFRADVIVNAANEELKHIGGVADAILKKGGQEIQVASDRHVKSRGRLSAGETWFSTVVGHLQCFALIHAVGPRWLNNPSGRQQLQKVCTRCLKEAKDYNSIALPAISSGIFECPIDQCAEILISTAIDFCNNMRNASLDEINIVLYKQSDVPYFVRALQACLPSQNIHRRSDSSTKVSSYDSSSHGVQSATYPSSHATSDQQLIESTESEEEEAEEEYVSVRGPSSLDRVLVQQGSILDVEAEIYVNSTNGNMDLSGGAVAQALAKAAGPALQAECTKKAPIGAGEIAVTKPGKILRCKCIIHINCPGYDQSGGQAETVLRSIMTKCMKECDRRGASTIVFPAIGTGNLGFPVSTAAHIMVDEVCNYLQKNKCKSLSNVYFIIFMENMYRTFCDELRKRRQGSGSVAQTQVHRVKKVKKVKKGKKKSRGLREEPHDHVPQKKYRGQRASEISHTPAEVTVNKSDHSHNLGNRIVVQIVKGDITCEQTDAIVNSTNRELSLGGGGVSAALLKKAGKDLQKACNEKKEEKRRYLSEGKVVDTRSGNLQCKRVFHIVFQKQTFVEVVGACINKAVELKFTSIAFPGIGTGMEGFPPEAAAKEMINGLQKCTVPYDLDVRIVLFEDTVYRAFITVIRDHQSTWLGRAGRATGRALKSLFWVGQMEQELGEEPMDVDTQEHETEMELRIFGETEECVKSAERSIYTLITKQFKTEDFEDKRISLLSRIQERKVEQEARRLQLVFHIDRNLNTAELKGSKDNIAEMRVIIEKALTQVEMEASRKAQAETMMKNVQWKRQDSNETEYAPETNLEIEGIYHKGKPSYTFHDSRSGEHFTIDFKAMEEIDHALGDRKCKIKRNTTGSEDDGLREDWEPMTDPTSGKEVPLRVVDLADTSEGYKFALAEFNKTMTQGTNYTAIVKIQRIQNPALYGQYAAKKKYLDAHNPQGVQNESWLFHGTKASSLSQINKTNFNRSFRGQNGTVYGQGCYFARDASYSNRYAQADTLPSLTLVSVSHQLAQPVSQQQKHMYLVRVLTGEFTRGAGAMIVAPPKDPSDPTVLFDSVVDNTANPSIFVVFYDGDAYPEYLITYT